MKYPSINNYIETITNPQGRFKTLTDIEIVKEPDGSPKCCIGSETIDFTIIHRGRRFVMRCYLRRQNLHMFDIRQKIMYMRMLDAPELIYCEPLMNEMLVFNDADEAAYYDVVLMEVPEGVTLGQYLYDACLAYDQKKLSALFKSFAEFAVQLIHENNYAHCNLQPKNIIITPDKEIKLINYRHMTIPTMQEWETTRYNDNFLLGVLTAMLYITAHNPELGTKHNADSTPYSHCLQRYMLNIVTPQINTETPKEFLDLYTLIRSDKDYIEKSGRLAMAISALAKANPSLLLKDTDGHCPDCQLRAPNPEENHPTYKMEGPFCEGLASATRNKRFGFIDRDGKEVIPFTYHWTAPNFEEGLVIVQNDEGYYGMINKDNKLVFPTIYEDLIWNAENGGILAYLDGSWMLMNREHQQISPNRFDMICDFYSDLAAVRIGTKNGYINRKGQIVIPLIYDEVSSFYDNGVADVVKNGRKYLIDTTGAVIGGPSEDETGLRI